MTAAIINSDCLDALRAMPDNSVDSIVTDPPYGLSNIKPDRITEAIVAWASGDRERVPTSVGFMGKAWDSFVPPPAVWDECLRVLKPGGHLVAFAGSRTHDLMGISIRMAGFEIRDGLAWLHAQGFPKGGSQLKPAFEPVTLARKPLEGNVAANVLKWGTGALNIDATRIEHDAKSAAWVEKWSGNEGHPGGMFGGIGTRFGGSPSGRWPANVVLDESQAAELDQQTPDTGGASRFFYVTGRQGGTVGPCDPANTAAPSSSQPSDPVDTAPGGAATSASHGGPSMSPGSSAPSTSATPTGSRLGDASSTPTILPIGSASSPAWQPAAPSPSGSPAPSVASPESATMRTTSSPSSSFGTADDTTSSGTSSFTVPGAQGFPGDELDARFKYTAKASSKERPEVDGVKHPTVKPLALMRWLVRLVTPPGGTVLDPFAGSGTTLEAAALEGFSCTGIELDPNYAELCRVRIKRADEAERDLFGETL